METWLLFQFFEIQKKNQPKKKKNNKTNQTTMTICIRVTKSETFTSALCGTS